MQRIDGAYLYELGATLRPLETVPEDGQRKIDIHFAIDKAHKSLSIFVNGSVFSNSIRTVRKYASDLLDELASLQIDFEKGVSGWEDEVSSWKIREMKDKFRKLEATLIAELQVSPLYLAFNKGGFDATNLIDFGLVIFPSDIKEKVPLAVEDAQAAARCLAFELFTAAGFHLHRCNESVLRKYFETVAPTIKHPRSKNMGDYLKLLSDHNLGDQKVISVLKSIKDLHRNPLMHPGDSISGPDEALNLYAAVRAAIGYMLDRIPYHNTIDPKGALKNPPSSIEDGNLKDIR